MKLEDLLSRSDDETLQLLLGESQMRLIMLLDSSLANPEPLRQLILRMYSAEGLLLLPEKRRILFDLLPIGQARLLSTVLRMPVSDNPYDTLKNSTFSVGTERTRTLFEFFGLPEPEKPVRDETATEIVLTGSYALFDHQRRAAHEASALLQEGPRRVILHMPTGAGKTRTAMNIVAERLRASEPTLIVWLAHTEELCEQAAAEFEKAWSYLGNRELRVFRFWGRHELSLEGDVYDGVVIGGLAKVYSATKQRIRFITQLAARTSLVIIDEAHSAIAETYKLILDALVVTQRPSTPLLGLTATPGRTWADISVDEELAKFFSRRKVTLKIPGYENPIDYLVDEGYLARVVYRPLFYQGGIDLSAADVANVESHFDIPESVLRLLANDEIRNLAVIMEIEALAKRHKRIIVFAATVEHSDMLAAVLQMRGFDAASVTGTTPTMIRSSVIARFKQSSETARIICNFGVLTTGFDAPQTSAALIARPTKSLVLYSQMVGRAIRGEKAGGNSEAEIVTVVDNKLPGFGSVAEAFNNWEDIWE